MAKQPNLTPNLSRRDYIELFLFMTPEEMIETFPEGTCASKSTIYRLVQDYYQGDKARMAQELREVLISFCPLDMSLEEFEKEVDIWVETAKVELIASKKKRLQAEAGLFQ